VTDDKKKPDGRETFDWDSALSEWDEKAFKPEVAKESTPEPPPPPARPLYRPPTDLMGKAPPPRPPRQPPPAAAPRPAGVRSPPPPFLPAPARSSATRTLPPAPPVLSSAPPTARAPTADDEPAEATIVAPLPDAPSLSTVPTSAVPRPTRRSSPLPPQTPSPVPAGDAAEFDVPEPRAPQATIPAAEEIHDVVHAATGTLPPPTPVFSSEGLAAEPDPFRAPPPAAVPGPVARADVPAPAEPAPPEEAPRSRPERRSGETRSWAEERPASTWLTEQAREALEARATWLENEARSTVDKVIRARGLLACSEILATVGELGRAEELATEARTIAPSVALAHRQARALIPSPADPDDYLVLLDIEAKAAPGAAPRAHTALVAAEVLRGRGDDDGAGKRLEQAARLVPADARPALARAARALGRQDFSNVALRLPESGPLAAIAEAIATALRLRGVERKDDDNRAPGPAEVLIRARRALDRSDLAGASAAISELAALPELGHAAAWLSAGFGAVAPSTRADAAQRLAFLADAGVTKALRPLAARGLELSDAGAVRRALAGPAGFRPAEKIAIGALAGLPVAEGPELAAAADSANMTPLVAAVGVMTTPMDAEHAASRAGYTAGSARSRAAVTLGRLLAAGVRPEDLERAVDAIGADAPPATMSAIRLELSARAANWAGVSRALEAWGAERRSAPERGVCALAAALVAERAGDLQRASEAYAAARKSDPLSEAALRALASLSALDLVSELNALADDLGEGERAAILRLEALSRAGGSLPDATCAALLEQVQRAAPALPIASFLGERMARRSGDLESAIRWIRDRQAHASDPIQSAVDAVREARLLMSQDMSLAADRLREAQVARPSDVALRELYERAAPNADDAAGWRERRAAESTGAARAAMYFEAALAYERAGDEEGALRCAEGAAATGAPLGVVARERAELRTGRVARLADELLSAAKGADDTRSRREAYQRLATLDATARHDPASALLWHHSILEESPDFKPSLRYVEHHLIGEGRDEELEPIASAIAAALRGTGSGESGAHAELAARLRMRGPAGSWDASHEFVEIAATEREPTIWSLRMRQAHARARLDDDAFVEASVKLAERATQPSDVAALLAHAGEAALRRGRLDEARAMLERATTEDPGDLTAWGALRETLLRAGDRRGAAEASEALARASQVAEHQLAAWYEAGALWDVPEGDADRAIVALEAAAAIDVAHGDVFDRLSRIYAATGKQPELAALLERRLAGISDPYARLAMEVQRGRLLLEVGDRAAARRAFESALGERPDDPAALAAFADLCTAEKDWEAAEQALVRLARLLPTPEEQRPVYARLGDLYAGPLVNLSRAEVALKEVLKRGPEDLETTAKLVDVYKRQNDAARAAELQLELVNRAQSPEQKRTRVLELAAIHENVGHDNRRAEQTLEAARREFPQDVALLRALAEFYIRHHQTPAVNILLDRAGADARRALAAGRFTAPSFGVIATVYDLRGKKDAAASSAAMLAALEGRPAQLSKAAERALDPRLDDLLAPEVLSTPLRALLAKTGDALDTVSPVDLRALAASPVAPDAPIARLATTLASAAGVGPVQVLVSPRLSAACMPIGARPPAPPCVVVGSSMVTDERIAPFLMFRAIKLISAKAAAFARSSPSDMAVLVSAWLKCFNPTWQPQGINPSLLNAAGGKLQAALPKRLDPDIGMLALEVAGAIGTQQVTLGPNAVAWGNRVALLGLGDVNVALDAIAASTGPAPSAPLDAAERATWVARTPGARDLIVFGVTDAFAEARSRLGLK
jgi:cellulose synthase operon protein C